MCSKTMFLINKNLSKEETKSKLKSSVIVPNLKTFTDEEFIHNKTAFVVQHLKQHLSFTTNQHSSFKTK